jgi:hypothetical protein
MFFYNRGSDKLRDEVINYFIIPKCPLVSNSSKQCKKQNTSASFALLSQGYRHIIH